VTRATVLVVAILLALLTAGFGGGAIGYLLNQTTPGPTVTHRLPSRPRIEKVRELASLVTLEVPITAVQETRLRGTTGGVSVLMLVKGEVQIATNLERARFTSIDPENRKLVLEVPNPQPTRPRLNHEQTRVLRSQRTGLWQLAPFDAGDSDVMNAAMKRAQQLLGETAIDERYRQQARDRCELALRRLFDPTGWDLTVRWLEPDALTSTQPAATQPGKAPNGS